MSRTHLLGAVSAAALSCISSGAFAQTSITGGGSTLAEFDYFVEFQTFNNAQGGSAAIFNNPAPATGNNILYWPAGSGSGQTAFLNDDISCDANKVLNTNGGACSGTVGGAAVTDYGASDATLSTTQINQWASSSVGQAAAGDLIQLPSMGVGIAFPVVNSKVTANGSTTLNRAQAGGVVLTDNDLCGIFSGKITDWSATSAGTKLTKGPITVVYRNDGSGTSFLLLNHLSAVCTTANSSFTTVPVVPSTTFASVFPNNTPPSNFQGEKGSSGVASYLANATGVSGAPVVTSAIGYVSPDFTSVDPMSNATLANGTQSQLYVAAIPNGNLDYLPTVQNVASALNHAKTGQYLTPPANTTDAHNPSAYVPLIQVASIGYPVVGYTTFDFAQCYTNSLVSTGIVNFLTQHYSTNASYATTINNNGFVAISASGAKKFTTIISRAILSNTDKYNTNFENPVACKGLVGR